MPHGNARNPRRLDNPASPGRSRSESSSHLSRLRSLCQHCTCTCYHSAQSDAVLVAAAASANQQLYSGPIVDPHHHFIDVVANPELHTVLQSALRENAAPGVSAELPHFTPEDYAQQFQLSGVNVTKSVYMEVIADDYVEEVKTVQALIAAGRAPWVKGIVGCANPAEPDFAATLDALAAAANGKLKGIRWILNWPDFPTGGPPWNRPGKDDLSDPLFARGFALLAARDLRFDLQCNSSQLQQAAAFCARFPDIPVALEHSGMPVLWPAEASDPDEAAKAEWHAGMSAMAALPHVVVQLDELNWAIPGWFNDPAKTELAQWMVMEQLELFGPDRCMTASNFPFQGEGLTAQALYDYLKAWVGHLCPTDQRAVFYSTANNFYNLAD